MPAKDETTPQKPISPGPRVNKLLSMLNQINSAPRRVLICLLTSFFLQVAGIDVSQGGVKPTFHNLKVERLFSVCSNELKRKNNCNISIGRRLTHSPSHILYSFSRIRRREISVEIHPLTSCWQYWHCEKDNTDLKESTEVRETITACYRDNEKKSVNTWPSLHESWRWWLSSLDSSTTARGSS